MITPYPVLVGPHGACQPYPLVQRVRIRPPAIPESAYGPDEDYRFVPCLHATYAIVSPEDYEWAMGIPWYPFFRSHTTYIKRGGSALMHRDVLARKLGRPLTQDEQVDHINDCGWDNRRANLRPCTVQENIRKRRKLKPRTSSYLGVSWRSEDRKWYAQIKINGKETPIGCLTNEVAAAVLYDLAALRHFREFARLNFPEHVAAYRTYLLKAEGVKENPCVGSYTEKDSEQQ